MSTEASSVTSSTPSFTPTTVKESHAAPSQDWAEGTGAGRPIEAGADTPPMDPESDGARADLMNHWAAESTPRPELAIDQLQAKIGELGGDDRKAQLEAVDRLAETQKLEADKQADAADRELDQEVDTKQAKLKADEEKGKAQLKAPPNQAPVQDKDPTLIPAKCGADRESMKADVESRADAELAELDQKFAEQKLSLDEKLAGQLGSLAAEQATQTEGMTSHLEKGNDKLKEDIQKRTDVHIEQIAKEQPALDQIGADAKKPLDTQAEADAQKALDDATKQADLTRKTGTIQATTIRNLAIGNAAAARAVGATKAAEATAAANARADELKKDANGKVADTMGVIATGIQRAMQAKAEGETQAKAIEEKAETDAKAAEEKAEADATAQLERGKQAAERARAQGKAGAGRVDKANQAAGADMKGKSDAAKGRMDGERQAAVDSGTASIGTATGAMTTHQTEAKAKADKEKADALAKMQASYDAAKTKIEEKRKQNLERIEKAKEKDLCRVQTIVDADLKVMERTSEDSEKKMKLQVTVAEQRLAQEVQRRKILMRGEAIKAKAAIDKFVREAKGRIATADKGTKAEIAEAAERGKAAIAEEGQNALADVARLNQDDRKSVDALADADRTASWQKVTDGAKDMADKVAAVATNTEQQWLDDAVKVAQGDLDDTGLFNVVTDDEANRALNAIASLPPKLQGKAVDELGDDQFENLLDEVPEENRKGFREMMKHSEDPERKLKLFKEQHKSQTDADVAALEGDTGHWYSWDTAEQDENDRRHGRRKDAASDTKDEVDEETEFLLDKMDEGETVTKEDVDKMIARKEREHEIEMEYNTNITNEEGVRKDGSKIVWTLDELNQLEGSFGQVPDGHMKGNKMLEEFRREDVDTDGMWWWKKENPGVGGTHNGGLITVFDNGVDNTKKGNFRHNGEARELASPHICGRCGLAITTMDMVVTHEIGHDVHDQEDEVFEEFQKASGWEAKSEGDLEDEGLTADDIKKLEDTREKGYSGRNQIRKNGKIYMVDPYGGGFLVVDEDAMPDDSSWGYARSNFKDHFAETYAKAVHVPKQLKDDLVTQPTIAFQNAEAARINQEQTIAAMKASGADTTAAEAQLATLKADEASKKDKMTRQGETYGIMREKIFHTGAAQSAARERMVAEGASPAKLAAFDAQAAEAATPAQIKTIEDGLAGMP